MMDAGAIATLAFLVLVAVFACVVFAMIVRDIFRTPRKTHTPFGDNESGISTGNEPLVPKPQPK